MQYTNKKPKKSKMTRLRVIIFLCILVTTGLLAYWLYYKDNATKSSDGAKTTSTAPTAQEDYSDGDSRDASSTVNDLRGTGGITDNNGSVSPETDTSNPIISATKEIYVYSPKANTSIKTGQQISGKSILPVVTYRLIDNSTGMIAYGELKVVGGNFSGIIGYSTSSKTGRLDIFGTREDGSEFSNIEIPLGLE